MLIQSKSLNRFSTSVILDSGSNMIYVPKNAFEPIADAIINAIGTNAYCDYSNGYCELMSQCSNYYQKLEYVQIKFTSQQWIFMIPPEYYLQDFNTIFGPRCLVRIYSGGNINFFILGLPFLQTFYSIYDFENRRLGIALHRYSSGLVQNEFKKYDDNKTTWIIIASCIGASLVLLVIVCAIIKKLKKKRLSNHDNDESRERIINPQSY